RMSLRDRPPYRADHVGSLLRPQALLEARAHHAAGQIDDAALKAAEDAAIADVVRMQEDVGLRSATDGEFRRASWHMDFISSLDYLNAPKQREHVREIGGDAEHQHEAYIKHINEALAAKPEGMSITTHMCRGNFRSSWVAEGGYDFVAEALFNDLAVDGFFME